MLKIAYHDLYVHPLPRNHKFPMEKYELLPQQLLYEGTISQENLFQPDLISLEDVHKVHSKAYIDRLYGLKLTPREQRVSGFEHSQRLIDREKLIMGGTKACAQMVLEGGVAMNIAGGTHHAFTDKGEGFCLMNDQAIAAQWLLDNTPVSKILIIDLDVHQGNGTAEIFADCGDVFTFSMHGEGNYPLKKEISNFDIGLPDKTGDTEYLNQLKSSLDSILEVFTPDFVFYQCGVDVVESDKLGRLALSRKGCKQRDQIVLQTVKELNTPLVCTMGGGYSEKIKDIVEAHANTYRLAQNIFY